jgi:hypothetical protein
VRINLRGYGSWRFATELAKVNDREPDQPIGYYMDPEMLDAIADAGRLGGNGSKLRR